MFKIRCKLFCEENWVCLKQKADKILGTGNKSLLQKHVDVNQFLCDKSVGSKALRKYIIKLK